MIGKLLILVLLLAAIFYFLYRPRGGPDDRGRRLPEPEPETPSDIVDSDDDPAPELEPADGERGETH